MRPGDETVEFEDVTCEAETDKAILCNVEGEDMWIPKGQLAEESEVWKKGDAGTLIVSRWIAEQKNLV